MIKGLVGRLKRLREPRRVRIEPLGTELRVAPNTPILSAALDAGVPFPHHCTVGTCGNCRCRLVSGDVRAVLDFSYTLTEAEIRDGYILACQALPKTDCVVEVEMAADMPAHPVETFHGTVTGLRPLTHDIVELTITIDRPMHYTAGQFADLSPEHIDRHRSYSFARACPGAGTRELVFNVRRVPGGAFTEWLFAEDRTGAALEVRGPQGAFFLREAEAPILAIAGGSGMAPIRAILEDAAARGVARPVTYLYGARTQADLYAVDEMARLAERWPAPFRFLPVLSEEPEGSPWSGERGLVTEHIDDATAGFPVAEAHAYLCGPPAMIDAALERLQALGVPAGQVHYDKFLDSRQLEAERPVTEEVAP